MHLSQTRSIPELGREIAALLDLFFVVSNVLTTRCDAHQTEPQTVGATFINQLEQIRRVAERLRHLSPGSVPKQAREINPASRQLVFVPLRPRRPKLTPPADHPRPPTANHLW